MCVGEDAFTHFFVLQRRVTFILLCLIAFLLPSEYVWLSPSCLSVFIHGLFYFLFSSRSVFVWLSSSCVLEKTCLLISSRLKRAEEGLEGDFARDVLLHVGEDVFILVVIVIQPSGFILHHPVGICITPCRRCVRTNIHQRRNYASGNTNPDVDAVFAAAVKNVQNPRICGRRQVLSAIMTLFRVYALPLQTAIPK